MLNECPDIHLTYDAIGKSDRRAAQMCTELIETKETYQTQYLRSLVWRQICRTLMKHFHLIK